VMSNRSVKEAPAVRSKRRKHGMMCYHESMLPMSHAAEVCRDRHPRDRQLGDRGPGDCPYHPAAGACSRRRAGGGISRQTFRRQRGCALATSEPIARAGDAQPQAALGFMSYVGRGVPRDSARPARLFSLAAEWNEPTACRPTPN
jgi:hypothetical protein